MTFAGVYYCTTHHGVANEDDEVCDFYEGTPMSEAGDDCKLHPLYYDVNDPKEG